MPFKLLTDKNLARLNRAVESGRIIPYLVLTMFVVGATGTAAVEILSPNSFSSLGDAAWWAATTVTTIGYGDVVPGTSGGRVIAVFVMFASVATVSFTTAVVTAVFVAYQQRRLGHDVERHQELLEKLELIESRLDELDRPQR
jgi:voltage-gated potassium channel Kch